MLRLLIVNCENSKTYKFQYYSYVLLCRENWSNVILLSWRSHSCIANVKIRTSIMKFDTESWQYRGLICNCGFLKEFIHMFSKYTNFPNSGVNRTNTFCIFFYLNLKMIRFIIFIYSDVASSNRFQNCYNQPVNNQFFPIPLHGCQIWWISNLIIIFYWCIVFLTRMNFFNVISSNSHLIFIIV